MGKTGSLVKARKEEQRRSHCCRKLCRTVYRGKTDRRANANGSTSGERVKHSLIRSRGEENALHAEMPEKRGYDTRTTATMCPEKTATMKMFEGEIESK